MHGRDRPDTESPRILALVTDAYGRLGGIAQYNRDLLDALEIHSRELTVLSLNPIDRRRESSRMNLHDSGGSRWAFVRKAMSLAWRIRPDVIFCGHINLAFVAHCLTRVIGSRLWIQVHGIDAWDRPGKWRRFGVDHADLVTAVSRYTRNQLLSWSTLAPDRVRVLPNTVSERYRTGPSDAAFRRRLGLSPENGPVLLTVARLTKGDQYKGMDDVFRAMVDLQIDFPDITYILAGDGDDRERLQSETYRLGIQNLVRFLGVVPDDELAQLYREADLFVMPSRKEGFGIVYVEAMASGTCALGLDQDGSVDALNDGLLGIVTQPERLVETMHLALRQKCDRTDLSERTRAVFGRDKFNLHVCRLLALLAEDHDLSEGTAANAS